MFLEMAKNVTYGQPAKQSAVQKAAVDGTVAYRPKGTVASFGVVVRRVTT